MENEKFKKGIQDIKEITMTSGEKKRILENVLNSPLPILKPVLSPWSFVLLKFKQQNNFIQYSIPVFLIVIFVSGGSIFASQKSLPGDIFYPIKVSVVEKINSAFITSPKEQALYQTELVTKRFAEAEILAKRGELDKNKEEKINKLLEKNISTFNKSINDIEDEKTETDISNVVTDFEAEINARTQVLDLVDYEKSETKKESKISKNIQEKTEKIKEDLKNKKDSYEKYEEKKEEIEKRIKYTSSDLLEKNKDDKSQIGQKITDDTNTNLNKAKDFLNKAEEKKKKGNEKDAYSYLIDSESSSKQAEIFFKSTKKIKKEKEEEKEKEDKKERD